MKKKLLDMLNPQSWGVSQIKPDASAPQQKALEIYLEKERGECLVGHLFHENSEFVFRYNADYNSAPIPAFPSLEDEYRSEDLWPFFAVRIPPLEREDVQREMSERHIEKDQIIDILGSLARFSVTSPYQFRTCSK